MANSYWTKQASVRYDVREGTLYVEWNRPWGTFEIEERKIASNVVLAFKRAGNPTCFSCGMKASK